MHFVYILYSLKLDRYYIGESADVERRLELHQTGYYKGSFTSKANDWELKLSIKCKDRNLALIVEKSIKKRKRRKFVENLIRYPELVEKLIEKSESMVTGSSAGYSAEQ